MEMCPHFYTYLLKTVKNSNSLILPTRAKRSYIKSGAGFTYYAVCSIEKIYALPFEKPILIWSQTNIVLKFEELLFYTHTDL